MKRAREAWREQIPELDADRLVFLDETWATTNLTRRCGRAPAGRRLVAAVPHGHWTTSTLVAALRVDGPTAPMVFDGAINGELFRACVERALVPTLHPGDVVVMDNLGSHKVAGVREAIAAAGASAVYLPPYSPDLNPIEQAFSKLKSRLRAAAARTRRTLWNRIGRSLRAFTPRQCRNYFRHCGYATKKWKRL